MTTKPQESWPRPDDIGKATRLCELVLRQVVTHTSNFLRGSLIELFDAFDETAFSEAIAAKDNETQILHFDAMRYVRLNKDRFITLFLFQFESSFEAPLVIEPVGQHLKPEASSLHNFYELFAKNKATIDPMVAKATMANGDTLEYLQLYFDSMQRLREVDSNGHPLDPVQLTNIFGHACRELTISVEAFFLLLNLWESGVLEKLPSMYASTLQILHNSDVASVLNGLAAQNPDAENNQSLDTQLLPALQKEQRPFTALDIDNLIPVEGNDNSMQNGTHISDAELVSKLNTLQAPLAKRLKEQKELQILDIRRVVEKVLEANWASGNAGFLTSLQEAAIQSVVFLFDGNINDNELPKEIRGLINQLQIPILKLMLLDNERFKEGNHPAICLLNEVACAGFEWGERADRNDDGFYRELDNIVNSILEQYVDDAYIFTEKLQQLQNFIANPNSNSTSLDQEVTGKSANAESFSIRQKVGAEILLRIHGNLLPPTILDFIIGKWLAVMTSCLQKYGEESDEWRDTLRTLDDLIDSVNKRDDPQMQAKIREKFPEIRNDMLKGLSRVSTNQKDAHQQLERVLAVQEQVQKPEPKKKKDMESAPEPKKSEND
ncbi:MAG: DUF1631 family protein [Pseudomonadales bacterium]